MSGSPEYQGQIQQGEGVDLVNRTLCPPIRIEACVVASRKKSRGTKSVRHESALPEAGIIQT